VRVPSDLDYVVKEKNGLRIGGLTTLDGLASSPLIREECPGLGQAARALDAYAHPGNETLGENLCQENRCLFYNQLFLLGSIRPPCYKAGGEACYVLRARKECHATYCGELAPVLIALDARVSLVGPSGRRILPIEKLYTRNGKTPLSLKEGEILREVRIPFQSGIALYRKRKLGDGPEFPAVSLTLRVNSGGNGRIERSKVVFSGVAPGPMEALESERMLQGLLPDGRLIREVARMAVKEVFPVRTSIHSPSYKRKMAGDLLRRTLEEARDMLTKG
jgi:4-hydroxybenzoyl-CoA reductase subunit beta